MKKSKLRKIGQILAGAVLAVSAVVFAAAMILLFLQLSGRSSLVKETEGAAPVLAEPVPLTDFVLDDDWQEGDVFYEGVHYRYNSDIMTFLFLGIDKMGEVREAESGIDGGQSDAVFLLVLDPHSKEISVIGVNRDTMTDVDVYNQEGQFLNTITTQLCLQHGYGDGAQLSCERTVTAVSRLFYGLPIHGYCSVNMGAIPLLNDAIGGVRVTALEDVPGSHIKKGDDVLLKGEMAYVYLHNRDTASAESARRRLERQKQYLAAYAGTAMDALKQDLSLPKSLYDILSKYMVTDISLDEVSYLAMQITGYHFSEDRIYSLEGETRSDGMHEGFYPDETALYELILQVFYEKV